MNVLVFLHIVSDLLHLSSKKNVIAALSEIFANFTHLS